MKLDNGFLRVERSRVVVGGQMVETSPKSDRSRRRVDLDAATVTVLRRWKARQIEERLQAGEAWTGGDDPYCVADDLGRPCRPDLLSDWFERAQDGSGFPRLTLHGLRHTSATIAIDAGVGIHVLSERLGHASTSITSDIYVHALARQHTDAAERIGGMLSGTKEGSR